MSLDVVLTPCYSSTVGVGFCEEHFGLDEFVGWDKGSWGYHADDGNLHTVDGDKKYGPKYGSADVIGCGVDFNNRTAFFTKNGKHLGKCSCFFIPSTQRCLSTLG